MYNQIVLESSDSASDERSNETLCSVQDEPTVSAKDSSDIVTEFSNELELASSPETQPHPWSFNPHVSSSGNSSRLTNRRNRVFFEPLVEENYTGVSETWTDSGDGDTDDDIQILKFPRCIMCSAANENHFFQFCHACYKIRKDFFPRKPKPKVGKRNRLEKSMPSNPNYAGQLDRNASKEKQTTLHELQQYFDSQTTAGVRMSGEISWNGQTLSKVNTLVETASPNCTQDSGIGGTSNNTPNGPHTDARMDDKCLACSVSDTNALFLHGKTGHRCCCYQCAKRIWFETRRCPICRSKVNNIIKILNS